MKFVATSVLWGIFLSNTVMAAARWNCSEIQWVGNSGMNSHGNLEAALSSSCRMALDAIGSIATLERKLQQTIASENQVNSGPTEEIYQGMPGVRYDVTNRSTDDNRDQIVMGRDVHIGTDHSSRLIYAFHSTKIDATGNAGFLRMLNYRQEVLKDEGRSDKSFQVRVTETIEVAKPWYVPEDLFISQAKKSFLSRFTKEIQVDLSHIAKQLTEE